MSRHGIGISTILCGIALFAVVAALVSSVAIGSYLQTVVLVVITIADASYLWYISRPRRIRRQLGVATGLLQVALSVAWLLTRPGSRTPRVPETSLEVPFGTLLPVYALLVAGLLVTAGALSLPQRDS